MVFLKIKILVTTIYESCDYNVLIKSRFQTNPFQSTPQDGISENGEATFYFKFKLA